MAASSTFEPLHQCPSCLDHSAVAFMDSGTGITIWSCQDGLCSYMWSSPYLDVPSTQSVTETLPSLAVYEHPIDASPPKTSYPGQQQTMATQPAWPYEGATANKVSQAYPTLSASPSVSYPTHDQGPLSSMNSAAHESNGYTQYLTSQGPSGPSPTSNHGKWTQTSAAQSRASRRRRFSTEDSRWKFNFHRKYGTCAACTSGKRSCQPKHLNRRDLAKVPPEEWESCPRPEWRADL